MAGQELFLKIQNSIINNEEDNVFSFTKKYLKSMKKKYKHDTESILFKQLKDSIINNKTDNLLVNSKTYFTYMKNNNKSIKKKNYLIIDDIEIINHIIKFHIEYNDNRIEKILLDNNLYLDIKTIIIYLCRIHEKLTLEGDNMIINNICDIMTNQFNNSKDELFKKYINKTNFIFIIEYGNAELFDSVKSYIYNNYTKYNKKLDLGKIEMPIRTIQNVNNFINILNNKDYFAEMKININYDIDYKFIMDLIKADNVWMIEYIFNNIDNFKINYFRSCALTLFYEGFINLANKYKSFKCKKYFSHLITQNMNNSNYLTTLFDYEFKLKHHFKPDSNGYLNIDYQYFNTFEQLKFIINLYSYNYIWITDHYIQQIIEDDNIILLKKFINFQKTLNIMKISLYNKINLIENVKVENKCFQFIANCYYMNSNYIIKINDLYINKKYMISIINDDNEELFKHIITNYEKFAIHYGNCILDNARFDSKCFKLFLEIYNLNKILDIIKTHKFKIYNLKLIFNKYLFTNIFKSPIDILKFNFTYIIATKNYSFELIDYINRILSATTDFKFNIKSYINSIFTDSNNEDINNYKLFYYYNELDHDNHEPKFYLSKFRRRIELHFDNDNINTMFCKIDNLLFHKDYCNSIINNKELLFQIIQMNNEITNKLIESLIFNEIIDDIYYNIYKIIKNNEEMENKESILEMIITNLIHYKEIKINDYENDEITDDDMDDEYMTDDEIEYQQEIKNENYHQFINYFTPYIINIIEYNDYLYLEKLNIKQSILDLLQEKLITNNINVSDECQKILLFGSLSFKFYESDICILCHSNTDEIKNELQKINDGEFTNNASLFKYNRNCGHGICKICINEHESQILRCPICNTNITKFIEFKS